MPRPAATKARSGAARPASAKPLPRPADAPSMAPPEAARPPAQGKTSPCASLEEAPGGAPALPRAEAPSPAARAPAPQGNSTGAPTGAPLALSPSHALMVTDIRCALESITEILETLALARSQFEQEKHLHHVSNGLFALGEVQRLTWVLSGEVRSVSATLTGVDVSTSVGVHLSALGRLGGYDADPWTREHELRSAHESFERAGEGGAA